MELLDAGVLFLMAVVVIAAFDALLRRRTAKKAAPPDLGPAFELEVGRLRRPRRSKIDVIGDTCERMYR